MPGRSVPRKAKALNPVERVIRRVDATQQRQKQLAFTFAVVKKYGDDNGGVLAGNLSHAGFIAVFPLLLVLVTTLGLLASQYASVRKAILNGVAAQFGGAHGLGSLLVGNVHALHRSSLTGLIVGLLVLVWGATGLAQAGLFTMEQVWNLPGPARPGYVPRLGRCMLFLAVLGLGVLATTLLTSLVTFGHHARPLVLFALVLAAAANVAQYFAGFRVLTPKGVPSRQLIPGAICGGIAWTIAQALGTFLVHHFLHSDSAYGIFATVLGLAAWISLGVEITIYAAEINVVLARRLWPRSIVQPPLTEADRSVMALQALQNQRREEQHVEVTFHDRPDGAQRSVRTPQTPDEVAPPAGQSGDDTPG